MLQTLKHITYLLMAMLLLVNTCALGLVKMGFELNRDYFEANYCVNKDRPELQCHATCHLHKSLMKVQDNQGDEQGNRTQPTFLSVNFIPAQGVRFADFFTPIEEQKHHSHYSSLYSYLSVLGTFHPPTQVIS